MRNKPEIFERKAKPHKIGIIGCGYVGTACEIGFAAIPNAEVSVYDKYKDTESFETVVQNSDILFVCVPTPMRKDGSCDTSIVFECVKDIDEHRKSKKIVVIKSTVPPGTTAKLQGMFPGLHLFFNPEFLTEACFIDDFVNQRSIIIGQGFWGTSKKLDNLYYDFIRHQFLHQGSGATLHFCSFAEAEMLKYATNCFLATKVIFFNEIYEICSKTNINFDGVCTMMKADSRIGTSHMQVPCNGDYGFAKSCFPKDLNALIAFAKENDVDPLVLESVWAKNLMVREKYDWETLPQVTGQYERRTA